jgi:tetratricopeptide (TPR) repeat protein
MSKLPHEVQLSLAEFDRNQLPEAQRSLEGDAFRLAVQEHLTEEFLAGPGAAEVIVTGDRIIIRWTESGGVGSLTERGITALQEGDYAKGIALLRLALDRNPDDTDALFNLAMALSDQRELEEATGLLDRLLEQNPGHSRAWVALGVARSRMGDDRAAIASLQTAIEINPADGYAQMNLGAILSKSGRGPEGLEHSRLAAMLMQSNPQAWFNFARNLEEADETTEADDAYLHVLSLDSRGTFGKLAEEGRNRIAEKGFRSHGTNLRPDAVFYCLGALQRFEGLPRGEIQAITFEIAILGTRGLDVNDPAPKYRLRSIPGDFSGLQLLCIEYVGFQILDPSMDIHFDLSNEYQEAKRLHAAGNSD